MELQSNEEEVDTNQSVSECENAAQVTFQELQSIIKGYQELSGLSFEKAKMGRLRYERTCPVNSVFICQCFRPPQLHATSLDTLRFFFKGLDKEDRGRQFTFLLSTTEDDFYQVEGCEPEIPNDKLAALIAELHQTDDLAQFFRRIRSVWCSGLP